MAFNPKDYYFKKAKAENYVARSVFKIEEIDKRFRIFKVGQHVLDLGAAPGSWSQYAAKKVGKAGTVVGVDRTAITITLPNSLFLQADLLQENLPEILRSNEVPLAFDMVLSDMAPNTTGIRMTDQARSMELCQIALQLAQKYLKPRGHFVCKLFHGEDFEKFRQQLRQQFTKVEILRPKSTRKESKEVFFIALNFNPRK